MFWWALWRSSFCVRYLKSSKFMPSGLILLFSVVVLAVLLVDALKASSQLSAGVQTSLPIWQIQTEIVSSVKNNSCVVIIAPTGSGKTTQVPQMLLDDWDRSAGAPPFRAALSSSNRAASPPAPSPPASPGSARSSSAPKSATRFVSMT